ncbi:unnamed protein product [Onchocerca flexuosa]|uniref:Uncharacterized protein n=1 Tax=Onchocerca flexuosa TaxID=387005 RepID=A0A3P8B488_9BILA|nr:unnamed protein product [Onchocerca flexuosa]
MEFDDRFNHDQDFNFSDQYCHTLRCSTDELCVVNEKTARCIKNDKLHDVDGVHIDFASGKPIHHLAEETSHYRAGRMKPHHNHEHLPRHYEHAETANYGNMRIFENL